MTKVKLTTPVSRKGADPVAEVTVAKPTVGTLRGLKLTDVLQMDVRAMERLLPRITQPALLGEDVAGLDPADFLALAGAGVGFFATADQMAALDPDRP
ncbi:MAG: phage tail assembly protein [Rhodobacter sp.]|nr:phage tail assembly protein [Rhodobacter sp.]